MDETEIREHLRQLQETLRLQRQAKESGESTGVFVVGAKASTNEALTLASAQAVEDFRDDAARRALLEAPELDAGKFVGDLPLRSKETPAFLLVQAPATFASRVRGALSTVSVAPETWVYPQMTLPLGAALSQFEIRVNATTKGPTLQVAVQDEDGNRIPGVRVRALLNPLSGVNVSAVTNAGGVAALKIPKVFGSIELVLAHVDHTYWPRYEFGMQASAIDPAGPMVITLPSLTAQANPGVAAYIGYEEDAGVGVRVGVIDSGIGPHDLLTVAGGANVVRDEPDDLIADNGLGHGTHVAGIIAARGGANGLWGVAPACELRSYRVCAASGINYDRAKSVDLAIALRHAIDEGCDLINISLGSVAPMQEVEAFLRDAQQAGCVVIAAMGNDGVAIARHPAQYEEVIGVSAFGVHMPMPTKATQELSGKRADNQVEFIPDFSNHGMSTDYAGPGVAVISTFPNNRLALMDGTSMAAPYVTGLAARLLSRREDILTMDRGPQRALAISQLVRSAASMLAAIDPSYQGNGHPR